MSVPSVKTLETRLRVTREQATTARGLMNGTIDPESIPETAKWVRDCYHRPWQSELVMDALSHVLGMYGVESLNTNAPRPATYLNAGDTYACTIVCNADGSRYYVTDVGTFIENRR